MSRFDDYLTEVQQRMGLVPINLIRTWTAAEITSVELAIRTAVAASQIVGMVIPNFVGTNQAKGNKAADFFIATIPPHLPANNSIVAARGAGYPDRLFVSGATRHCMEFKATSNWQDGDPNRRVLTSAPTKMIRLVNSRQVGVAPNHVPAHLICTVLYSEQQSSVQGVRLDFLEPDSEVNIRLEASTSQRLLAMGTQQRFIYP
ncbi:hypothetical protein [Fuscovulum blasticum]|nr:hypothetical protein [Fuscovulum blasticum]